MALRRLSLDDLAIDDEASFRGVALYGRLKDELRRARHVFQVPAPGETASWDRALFLNLTYWSPTEEASVLPEEHVAPDVVAHTALHHVVARELARRAPDAPATPAGLLLAESIASAFDVYLVGRLVETAPECDFIASQVPIMAEAAEQAGLDEAAFARLVDGVRAAPERAFEELRALLFDAGEALAACADAGAAQAALEALAGARFAPLLHHFQLSNWILYSRAYAREDAAGTAAARALDAELRGSGDALAWIETRWLVA